MRKTEEMTRRLAGLRKIRVEEEFRGKKAHGTQQEKLIISLLEYGGH